MHVYIHATPRNESCDRKKQTRWSRLCNIEIILIDLFANENVNKLPLYLKCITQTMHVSKMQILKEGLVSVQRRQASKFNLLLFCFASLKFNFSLQGHNRYVRVYATCRKT